MNDPSPESRPDRDDRPIDPSAEWHRGYPEARIGGVCSALARHLDVPLPAVRTAFVLAAVFPGIQGFGLTLYLAIWALTPPAPNEASVLDRAVDSVSGLVSGRRERPDRAASWDDADPR